jgi:Fe-S-cluster containining protein
MGSDQPLFECTRCGDCCKGYGGTFLTEADISAISAAIGVSASEFLERYCVLSGQQPVLSQQSNGYCIFYDQGCSIHPVKPRMCRQWPFIRSLMVDIANWRIMASVCPGMNTQLNDRQLLEAIRREIDK